MLKGFLMKKKNNPPPPTGRAPLPVYRTRPPPRLQDAPPPITETKNCNKIKFFFILNLIQIYVYFKHLKYVCSSFIT